MWLSKLPVVLISFILFEGPVYAEDASGEIDRMRDRNFIDPEWRGQPEPLYRKRPRYPRTAASQGKEGWVHMEFIVNAKGEVENERALDSYPADTFEKEALRALRGWKYPPPIGPDGSPVPYRREVVFTFELDGEDGVAPSIGRKLRGARTAILQDQDFEEAERLIEEVKDTGRDKWLNFYELGALYQTEALLAFSLEDYAKAVEHGERALRIGHTLDDANKNLIRRILTMAYINLEAFKSAVLVFDEWAESDSDASTSSVAPSVEAIRAALEAGRPISTR